MLKRLRRFIGRLFGFLPKQTAKEKEINIPPDFDFKPRPAWLIIAQAELGQKEIPGPKHNERIVEYGKSVKLEIEDDETPWCSVFVNYCLQRAGFKGTHSALARSFLQWGQALDEPKKGAIMVFKRGSSSWQGHVGFYIGETKKHYEILGGNQTNSVRVAKYKKEDLIGIRWPKD